MSSGVQTGTLLILLTRDSLQSSCWNGIYPTLQLQPLCFPRDIKLIFNDAIKVNKKCLLDF